MKKGKLIFVLLLWLIMLFMTLACFTEIRGISFSHESASYLTELNNINIYVAIFCLLAFLVVVFGKIKYKLELVFFISFLWVLSGRTVGIKPFPDGRIVLGFYCVEFGDFNLCSREMDCDLIMYTSKFEALPLWRIRIYNDSMDRIVLVGPFTYGSTINLLSIHLDKLD